MNYPKFYIGDFVTIRRRNSREHKETANRLFGANGQPPNDVFTIHGIEEFTTPSKNIVYLYKLYSTVTNGLGYASVPGDMLQMNQRPHVDYHPKFFLRHTVKVLPHVLENLELTDNSFIVEAISQGYGDAFAYFLRSTQNPGVCFVEDQNRLSHADGDAAKFQNLLFSVLYVLSASAGERSSTEIRIPVDIHDQTSVMAVVQFLRGEGYDASVDVSSGELIVDGI